MTGEPSVQCNLRVQWSDTDASGHYHHACVGRWVETAEAELYRTLGVTGVFGSTPRVRYEADYLAPLWFGDRVRVRLWVAAVGTSSVTHSFDVLGPDGEVVARGRQVAVHVTQAGGVAAPWPQSTRDAMTGTLA